MKSKRASWLITAAAAAAAATFEIENCRVQEFIGKNCHNCHMQHFEWQTSSDRRRARAKKKKKLKRKKNPPLGFLKGGTPPHHTTPLEQQQQQQRNQKSVSFIIQERYRVRGSLKRAYATDPLLRKFPFLQTHKTHFEEQRAARDSILFCCAGRSVGRWMMSYTRHESLYCTRAQREVRAAAALFLISRGRIRTRKRRSIVT